MVRSPFVEAVKRAIANDPESWMAPHRDAMAFFDYRDRFQEWISDQSAAYSFISSHAKSWERAIEEDNLEFDEADESEILSLFRNWLIYCSKVQPDLRQLMREATGGGTSVSGAEEFLDQIKAAKAYIARVDRIAAKERSHGMRDVCLDEAEAEAYRRLVPGSNPNPDPASTS